MEWISVEDRLPDTCGDFLVWMPKSNHIAWAFLNSDKRWAASGFNNFYAGVTHWMPLPEPPENDDE